MTWRFVPEFGLRAIQIVILAESILRGLMYIFIPPATALTLTELERSAPLAVWGSMFITFSVLGLFGEALMSGTDNTLSENPRAWPSFVSHSCLMIMYITLGVAYAASVVHMKLLAFAVVPYDTILLAYLHWLFARKRKRYVP